MVVTVSEYPRMETHRHRALLADQDTYVLHKLRPPPATLAASLGKVTHIDEMKRLLETGESKDRDSFFFSGSVYSSLFVFPLDDEAARDEDTRPPSG